MDVTNIARVAHEINRAYCASIGDTSQVSWDDAPMWQRDSAVVGVNLHINNKDTSSECYHESWIKEKVESGWIYGATKDAELKTHPCILPYKELPVQQKSKDYIFRAVVHALGSY